MSEEPKMKQIRIEKVTFNIGTGAPGDNLDKGVVLLNKITGAKTVKTKTVKRIPTWGLRPGLEIGCRVTLRGKKAHELLVQMLKGVNNALKASQFDNAGNLAFGIKEYLDVPGIEYDASIGIRGFEIAVTLERPGYRVKKRVLKKAPVGKHHRITKEEAILFMQKEFNVVVEQ